MQIIIFSSSDSCHSLLLPINISATSKYLENLPNFSVITHSLYHLWDCFYTWILLQQTQSLPTSYISKWKKCQGSQFPFQVCGLHIAKGMLLILSQRSHSQGGIPSWVVGAGKGSGGSVGRAGNAAGAAWDYAMATAATLLDVKNLPQHLKANISTGCSQIMANWNPAKSQYSADYLGETWRMCTHIHHLESWKGVQVSKWLWKPEERQCWERFSMILVSN